MKIDDFMHLGGENFRVEREGREVSNAEGIRDKSTKEIRFRPDADVRAEDWLVAETDRRYYVLETDFEQGFDHETLALVASYQTEAQHATASDQTPSQPTQQFTFHAPAYGIFGSQQDFTFDQVIHDLDRKIEEHGGQDKEELRQMVAEIEGVLESQDSISRSKFSRWSELANKHFPWLMGPLGTLLVNYAFGPSGAG